jgi:predicted RNase H-like HicB family nuclease
MMTRFIALLRKDANSDFGVDFPDFPGCVTAASTLEEAARLAEEALRFHIEGMIEDANPIPEPSTLDDIRADPDNRDAVAFLVEVPTVQARAVRVNITMPADLLVEIDRASNNRSRFLAQAARAALDRVA